MTSLRVLIVDDEEPSRELLRSMLAEWPNVSIVGEASDGAAAVEAVRAEEPDVVFLDVQMPTMNGFEVIAALADGPLPTVVFVTAYDQYALRAFEVSACDYLLKPFDAARLSATMTRVLDRQQTARPARAGDIDALVSHLRWATSAQVVVKSEGRHVFLNDHEIEWVEAVGKELHLHLRKEMLVVREPMSSLQQRLEPSRFLRVHRAAIVNRIHIREMQPWFSREYVLIMRGGARIITGPTYREAVQALFTRRPPP